MASVAVFGGSFSPVHDGHMAVASQTLANGLAEEVWMMPCRLNPLKNGKGLLPDDTRVRLLRDAVEYYRREKGQGGIKVDLTELQLPSPSYTALTLRHLAVKYPLHRFCLLVGADSYRDFEKWKDWKWIEENFNPIVYPRPGYEIMSVRPNWTLLENVKETDASSSAIREGGLSRDDLRRLMPWMESASLR